MKRFVMGTCKVLSLMFAGAVGMVVIMYGNDRVHEDYMKKREEIRG